MSCMNKMYRTEFMFAYIFCLLVDRISVSVYHKYIGIYFLL